MVEEATETAPVYIEYDAQLGYGYLPNVDLSLRRPDGVGYHFQTNAACFRSSRAYVHKKPGGITRIIVCGDSMSAGQFVSNEHRFSEQLERRNPGLEVLNLSLEGSGTDQQLLLYEKLGAEFEHDLVLLMPFLSNIRRNMVSARLAVDARTGQLRMRSKPRFVLAGGELKLENVPVPEIVEEAKAAEAASADEAPAIFGMKRDWLNSLPGIQTLKQIAYSVLPWEPFPEFRDPGSPAWRLMEGIVARFKRVAGDRPLVIAPTFYDSYVRYRMARNYWRRFKALERSPGVHVIDLLPHFRALGADALKCFQVPYDMHFSAYGHLIMAEALNAELRRQDLLPTGAP